VDAYQIRVTNNGQVVETACVSEKKQNMSDSGDSRRGGRPLFFCAPFRYLNALLKSSPIGIEPPPIVPKPAEEDSEGSPGVPGEGIRRRIVEGFQQSNI
jgi:hypothetical protein